VTLDSLISIPRLIAPTVVYLRSEIPASHPSAESLGDERMGSGVAVAPNRVLTAHYVVLGASSVEVIGAEGTRHSVRKINLDHETGLALLGLDGPPLPVATVGAGDEATPGLPVFLIAAVGGQERKGATGIVSQVGPFETYWEYMLDRAILTTCVNPGLAGAPLFDPAGRVIGIVSLGLLAVGRASVAIPVDLYWRHREELEGLVPRRPARAWLGVHTQAAGGAVVVTGVVSGGPSDKASIRRGDVILSVEGEETTDLRSFYSSVQKRRPGEALGLQILRDTAILAVEVETGERHAFFA
jgi:serine protease DegQ